MSIDRLSGSPSGPDKLSTGKNSRDDFYNEYINDCRTIDKYIKDLDDNQIRFLHPGKEKDDLLKRRAELVAIRNGKLHSNYQDAYNKPITDKSINDYNTNRNNALDEAERIYKGEGGNSDIQKDYQEADKIVSDLESEYRFDKDLLDKLNGNISALENKIKDLESQNITTEPALSNLKKAREELDHLKSKVSELKDTLTNVKTALDNANKQLSTLQELANGNDPTKTDEAHALLKQIKDAIGADTFKRVVSDLHNNLQTLDKDTKALEDLVQHIVPGPGPEPEPTPGRSPDYDKIHDHYNQTDLELQELIQEIRNFYRDKPLPPSAQKAINDIQNLRTELNGQQNKFLNNGSATIAGFDAVKDVLKNQATDIKNRAISGELTKKEQIEQALTDASKGRDSLQNQIDTLGNLIKGLSDSADAQEKLIRELEDKVNALPPGEEKNQALEALRAAKADLADLKSQVAALNTNLSNLKNEINGFNALISQLEALSKIADPTQSDLDAAKGILAQITGKQSAITALQADLDRAKALSPKIASNIVKMQELTNPYMREIKAEYDEVNQIIADLNAQKTQDEAKLASLNSQIAQWQKIIDSLSARAANTPELRAATDELNRLKGLTSSLKGNLDQINSALGKAQGALNDLAALRNKNSPDANDKAKADSARDVGRGSKNEATQAHNTFNTNYPANLQTMQNAIKALQDKFPPLPSPTGEDGYIDMGYLYSFALQCSVGWNGHDTSHYLDSSKLDKFFFGDPTANPPVPGFFDQLLAGGVKDLDLAFGQLCDIERLLKGESGGTAAPGSDKIMDILRSNFPVCNSDGSKVEHKNFLDYFVDSAHSKGMKVNISMGGVAAGAGAWTFPMGPNGQPISPEQLAADLAQFLDDYGLDGIDIDIESQELMEANKPENVITFFQELHKRLSSHNPPQEVMLTVMASHSWATGAFKPLFDHFDECFDALNLMCYNGSFYLDPNHSGNNLKGWFDIIKDKSKIHVGFYDSVNYRNLQYYGDYDAYGPMLDKLADQYLLEGKGHKLTDQELQAAIAQFRKDFGRDPTAEELKAITLKAKCVAAGITNGQAAAAIYLETLKQSGVDVKDLGDPFFWKNQPMDYPKDPFIKDFTDFIKSHTT